jgi:hypothetical protein
MKKLCLEYKNDENDLTASKHLTRSQSHKMNKCSHYMVVTFYWVKERPTRLMIMKL